MPYRNKIFASFDGDKDIHYYRLMKAWHQSDRSTFNFFDAHDINTARDSSLEATIKRRLRERLLNSRVFVSLVGESTRYLYKFVRWEIEQAISLNLPIIAVNLNGKRVMDPQRCPPLLRDTKSMHISFNAAILEYSLEHWPRQHASYETKDVSSWYYFNDQIYRSLGL